jgi:hypothetical protein
MKLIDRICLQAFQGTAFPPLTANLNDQYSIMHHSHMWGVYVSLGGVEKALAKAKS